MSKKEYILGVDYTIEEGRVVWTSEHLAKKGICCGNACDNCPYTKSFKGNTKLRKKYKSIE
jgi:hypothetical protein